MSTRVPKHSACSGHKFGNTLYLLFMSFDSWVGHTHTHIIITKRGSVSHWTRRCSSYIRITAATYTNSTLEYTITHYNTLTIHFQQSEPLPAVWQAA